MHLQQAQLEATLLKVLEHLRSATESRVSISLPWTQSLTLLGSSCSDDVNNTFCNFSHTETPAQSMQNALTYIWERRFPHLQEGNYLAVKESRSESRLACYQAYSTFTSSQFCWFPLQFSQVLLEVASQTLADLKKVPQIGRK